MSDNADLRAYRASAPSTVVRTTWIIAGGLAAAGRHAAGARRLAEARPLLQHAAADLRRGDRRRHRQALWRDRRRPAGRLHRDAGRVQLGAFCCGRCRRSLPEWIEMPAKLAFVPTEYKIVVPFFILIAVLIWRPDRHFQGEAGEMMSYRIRALLLISRHRHPRRAGLCLAGRRLWRAHAGRGELLCPHRARPDHPVGLCRPVQRRRHGLHRHRPRSSRCWSPIRSTTCSGIATARPARLGDALCW